MRRRPRKAAKPIGGAFIEISIIGARDILAPHGNFASRLFSRPVIPMAPRSRARRYQNMAVPAVALCAHTAHGVPRQAIPLPGRLRKGRGISAQPPSGSPPQEPKVCRLTAGAKVIRTPVPPPRGAQSEVVRESFGTGHSPTRDRRVTAKARARRTHCSSSELSHGISIGGASTEISGSQTGEGEKRWLETG